MLKNTKAAAKFVATILPCFRVPGADAQSAAGLTGAYVGVLQGYSSETLEAAADKILRTRLDPFFPTAAECIKVCEAIDADARKRAAELKTTQDYARLRIKAGIATASDYWALELPVPSHVATYSDMPGDH